MAQPRILVDADSFPQDARKLMQKACRRLGLELHYYANHDIPFEIESPLFKMTICENEKDAADDCIVRDCTESDIAATRDILLARRLLDRKMTVINDRGTLFDDTNLARLLEQREESLMYSMLGLTKGSRHSSYGKKELHDFAACFDAEVQKKIQQNPKN